jgi:O-antigen ligase
MITIRVGRGRLRFDWQILPFALAALIGLSLAYDVTRASIRLALIVVSLLVYLFFINKSEPAHRQPSVVRLSLSLLPVILAIYLLLTNDWTKWAEKLAFLSPVTDSLARLQFAPQWLQINPNAIGGALAALLPLQIVALKGERRATQIIFVGITLVGLALSQTRGAWLALGLTLLIWLVWRVAQQHTANLRRARLVWGLIVTSGLLIILAILTTPSWGEQLLRLGGGRLDIWRNSLALIGDYPITGHGLAGFEMVYASYALLTHVGHTMHAHNLWLDIWLEQGLLGLVAFSGLLLNAVWPRPQIGPWRMAALASVAVILLHGLVDDSFYGYGGILIPLLLIPLALLVRDDAPVSPEAAPPIQRSRLAIRIQPAFVVWGAALVATFMAINTPGGRSIIETNLGANAQTQAELSVYQWPRYGLPDVLRQSGVVDLGPASAHYTAALAIDPNNASANRRLGQIQLSLGDLETACQHLERAYAAAPDQRATAQLLGECYALHDKPAQAVQLWRTIDVSEGQLIARQWWYGDYLAARDQAERLKQASDALNQP